MTDNEKLWKSYQKKINKIKKNKNIQKYRKQELIELLKYKYRVNKNKLQEKNKLEKKREDRNNIKLECEKTIIEGHFTDRNFNVSKTPDCVSKYANSNAGNLTQSEKLFQDILIENDINFELQKPISIVTENKVRFSYIFDFFIPKNTIAIEIDGGYHLTKKQTNKDRVRDFIVSKVGITTVRLTNDDVIYKSSKLLKTIEYLKNQSY